MKKNNLYIGWDIGGAHTKFTISFQKNDRYLCKIILNELWRPKKSLSLIINKLHEKYHDKFNIINAITMSGEMSDIFKDRKEGVNQILSSFKSKNVTSYIYNIDEGLIPIDSKFKHLSVASANWHIIAKYLSNYHKNIVAIDIGSTTTDIILIKNFKCINKRKDDFSGLRSLELLYTGVLRTPIYSVVQNLSIDKKTYNVIPEDFATMSDIYRILSIIPAKFNYSTTADAKHKTIKDSFIRLARIFGFDYSHINKSLLLKLAKKIHTVHLGKISCTIKSHIIKNFDSKNNFKIVGMGVGQELVKSIANKNKWDYSSLNNFININYDKNITNPSDLAPSYLLSRLLKDYHE
tara:strand:+ start:2212 stop:3261 length:1050 start_codon:yes stop_codon:yes gene_type:complete